MEPLRDRCSNFLQGKKRRLLVLPIYILCVIIFDLILGACTEDLWDKLVGWSKKSN